MKTIKINLKQYEFKGRFISGNDVLKLANAPFDYGVWVKTNPEPDRRLLPTLEIDLEEEPNVEFYTGSLTAIEG